MLKRRHRNSRRHADLREHPAHEQWVRGHRCLVECSQCSGRIECCHVDYAGSGPERKYMSGKVPSWKVVPMCSEHHRIQHAMGWQRFERVYGINAEREADDLARRSPRAQEMREAREALMEQGRASDADRY